MDLKNKKIIRSLGILFAIFVLATSALVWAIGPKGDKAPEEYKIGESYSKAIKEDKPFVLMFYGTYCTYCKKFMPTIKELSENYKDEYNFVMVNADDEENGAFLNDYAIGSVPTLYIVDPKIDNRVLISNTIYGDVGRIKRELDRFLRVRSMIKF